MLHGAGTNRWLDKSFQLIVTRNAKAADPQTCLPEAAPAQAARPDVLPEQAGSQDEDPWVWPPPGQEVPRGARDDEPARATASDSSATARSIRLNIRELCRGTEDFTRKDSLKVDKYVCLSAHAPR